MRTISLYAVTLIMMTGCAVGRKISFENNATPRVVDIRYDVTWEFEVNVFNRSGDLLATKAVADRVTRDKAQLGINKEYLQKMAEQSFVEQIRNLLNDPAVKASLMN